MWSAADCFCEFVSVAIGRYCCADVATVEDTVGGHALCRKSSDHKQHLRHAKALWRLPLGRNTAS
jgi:hypothetical protein